MTVKGANIFRETKIFIENLSLNHEVKLGLILNKACLN